MSEVRSSELKTGLLSSGDLMEGDTAVSNPHEVRAFYTLKEECGLDADTLGRLKDRFQFSKRVRFVCPVKRNGPTISFLRRCAFTSPPSFVG